MKRFVFLTLALALLLCTGCGKTVYDGPEALLYKVVDKTADAEGNTQQVRYLGQCEKGSGVLFWYVCEAKNTYYAMVCQKAEKGGYLFEAIHNTVERGENIVFYQWGDGYVFCIDNPDCRLLRYTDYAGEHEVAIEEGDHPFIYRTVGAPVAYSFLDADGSELQ